MICEPDLDLIAESKECFGNVEGGGGGHARHDPNVSWTPFIDKKFLHSLLNKPISNSEITQILLLAPPSIIHEEME